jgi:membrane fusion protein, multidrug efflux system
MTSHDLPHHEQHADVGAAPPVRPMSRRTLGMIAAVTVVVLLLLLVVTLLPRRSVEHELLAEAAARDSAPLVEVTTVHRAAPGSTLALPSTIQPLHESAVYARVGGYVKHWYADLGSVVHAGQLLVDIDAPELDQEVQQAQSQLSQTKAALGLAKADLERWRELARDSAVTGQELDQKRASFEAATANTGASEANLRRLTQMRQYTRVVAPFAGVVTARNIDIGSLITAGGATTAPVAGSAMGGPGSGSLYRIAQTDTVRTYLTVPEAYATSIQPGLKANIQVEGLPGRVFTGIVARTSHSLDAASRTLLTEVDVPNRDFALLPGMYAKAQLTFPRATPPLVLPANTILVRGNGVQVVLVNPSPDGRTAQVHFRSVQVIRDYGASVEVAGDVTDGMMVVANPGADLGDGAKVRIRQASQRIR